MYETKKDDSAPVRHHQESQYTNPWPAMDYALNQDTKNKNKK